MSLDWNIVCHKCRCYHHLGQSMGGKNSFGYGSQDNSGRDKCALFISNHIDYNNNLEICFTDMLPDYTEDTSGKRCTCA